MVRIVPTGQPAWSVARVPPGWWPALAVLLALVLAALPGTLLRAAEPGGGPSVTLPALRVHVNLRQAPQRLIRVRESIRAQPGPLTLYYPEWIPGEHGPNGPIANVAGLTIHGNGKTLRWRRDLRNMYALHLDVPEGVERLDLSFQFLPSRHHGRFGAGPSTGTNLAVLEFNQVVFYPAGRPVSAIRVQASVRLPDGWQHATTLDETGQNEAGIHFSAVPLDRLIDSPLICGQHFNRIALGRHGDAPISLQVAGTRKAEIRPDDKQAAALQKLGQQALVLFGQVPYRRYKLLVLLSDQIGHFGLEHRESSDDRLPAEFFSDPTLFRVLSPLLAHEWIHAWNGKFRYPADLHADDFNTPVQTDMLWVYEGLTDYWASVLSARAGLWTADYFRASLASTRNMMLHRSGRAWRTLQDTADAAQLAWDGSRGWYNWRRSADFYPEGQLLWLDVDTTIRQLSRGHRSLDDFARAFFGRDAAFGTSKAFDFDELVTALNSIQPNDWVQFLRQRLNYTGDKLPYGGVQRAGWKLVYRDQPNARDQDMRGLGHGLSLTASAGFSVSASGSVRDVQWQGPASRAGLVPNLQIVAVNGRDFSLDVLTDAIAEAARHKQGVKLLVRNDDIYRTLEIDYHGGLRYAHLERVRNTPDRLADIIRSRQ